MLYIGIILLVYGYCVVYCVDMIIMILGGAAVVWCGVATAVVVAVLMLWSNNTPAPQPQSQPQSSVNCRTDQDEGM